MEVVKITGLTLFMPIALKGAQTLRNLEGLNPGISFNGY